MKILFPLLAAALLCGCQQKHEAQDAALKARVEFLESRLAATEALSSNLDLELVGVHEIVRSHGNSLLWTMTNVADMRFRVTLLSADYDARQEENLRNLRVAMTKKYGAAYASNYFNVNPATGLPWLPGEK